MEWFHSFIFHCGGRKNLCKNADVEVKYSNSPNADPKFVLHYHHTMYQSNVSKPPHIISESSAY